jgi:uroporphyrinogen III methyltransferase/synthase
MVQLSREGKTVVRLKNGDPAVFARIAEETETLVAMGVPFESVPGITAAWAASSYAGIPLTQRDVASAVALVTAQENEGKSGESLNYQSLAAFPGTLVFYMGVTTAPIWTAKLMAAGKPPETPVAIVRRCSGPDQRLIRCSLRDVAEQLAPHLGLRPPIITIVGEVARMEPAFNWFERRALFGRRILVTRPESQAGKLAELLEDLGADVLQQPAIEISPPADWALVDRAVHRLHEFAWLVFSSANGVRFFLDRLLAVGRDLRSFGSCRIAVIGPGTADELLRYHLRADLQPATYRAEALADELAKSAGGSCFLLVRASRGREVLAERLVAAGGRVEQIVAYRSTDTATPHPDIAARWAAGEIDYITVTSSAIARSLVHLFGERPPRGNLVSISPVTSETLRELGWEANVEAASYTMQGVVDAIVQHAQRANAIEQ